MTRYEQTFTEFGLTRDCSCGETISVRLTAETGSTLEDILDVWLENHPEGGYVGSSFHSDLTK